MEQPSWTEGPSTSQEPLVKILRWDQQTLNYSQAPSQKESRPEEPQSKKTSLKNPNQMHKSWYGVLRGQPQQT